MTNEELEQWFANFERSHGKPLPPKLQARMREQAPEIQAKMRDQISRLPSECAPRKLPVQKFLEWRFVDFMLRSFGMKTKSGGYRGIFGFFLKLYFRTFHRPLTRKEWVEQCITNLKRRHGIELSEEIKAGLRDSGAADFIDLAARDGANRLRLAQRDSAKRGIELSHEIKAKIREDNSRLAARKPGSSDGGVIKFKPHPPQQ